MNRSFRDGGSTAFLIVGLAAAAGATTSKAFSILPYPHMSEVARNTVFLDSGFAGSGQVTWLAGARGTTSPPSNAQVLGVLDRVAQQWSMYGRAFVSVRMNASAVSLPFSGCASTPLLCVLVDNQHDIIHAPQPAWMGNGGGITIGFGSCLNAWDCDVFIPDGNTFALLEDGVTNVGATAGFASFGRNVGHEVGHLLGIAHPEPQNVNCALNAQSPLMCQTAAQNGGNMKWDHAAFDDLSALRFVYGETQQAVRIVSTSLGSNGAMAWSQQTVTGLPEKFVTQPRIACQSPNAQSTSPSCVLAATTEDCDPGFPTCVSLYAIHPGPSSWSVVARTDLNNSAHHQVDVAFGRTSKGALTVRSDSSDQRVWFAWWDLIQNSNVTQGTLTDTNGAAAVAHSMPRAAWHEGIQRCIIVYADRTRSLWVATSTSSACKAFNVAVRMPFAGAVKHHPAGLFDVACPSHEKVAGGYAATDLCVITMNEQTSALNAPAGEPGAAPTAPQREQLLNGNMTACTFTVTAAGAVTGASCATPAWQDTMQVSISTARYGASPTMAWLASVSRRFPASNDNTAQILAISPLIPTPAQALSIFNIPISGVSRSDWGGMSCDFSEANSKVVCAQLEPTSGVAW